MTSPARTETPREAAARIVAGLSVDDCIALVSGRDFWSTAEIPGIVPSIGLANGSNGLGKQAGDQDHIGLSDMVPATCFPPAAVLGSTWDPALVGEVGEAIARECRAQDVAVLLGPGLNMKRHARSGRNFEYYAEDPVQAGIMAAALIEGVQRTGVAVSAKHFALANQEAGRMIVDVVVDERTAREVYLRAFEIVVERGRPRTVMAAYHRINGTYCSDNAWLLDDVLRREWGFDGLVMSDWGGTSDRVAALRAGLDLEMPGNGGVYEPEIRAALASGTLDEAVLRTSATRVVELALGGDALRREPAQPVDLDAHHALARRAAVSGTVLLANDGLLPLGDTDGLALIGAYAESPRFQGGGSARVNATRIDSLREALGADLPFAAGYDPDSGEASAAQVAEAQALAAAAGRVVLVVGMPASFEAETLDRTTVRLPASMDDLVRAVCAANPRTVVVVMAGGSLELDWVDQPAALLFPYLGGQAVGSALADMLLGAAEPGGRLAESFPVRVADLPADANFPGGPRQVQYREGQWIGYRFHDAFGVAPLFAFGHGLGYTTWELGGLAVTGEGTALTAAVDVTNTGGRRGSTVVQVYLAGPDGSVVARPPKILAGFARVELDAGASARVEVPLEPRAFRVWDQAARRWVVEPGRYTVLAGTASTAIAGRAPVEVVSADTVTAGPRTTGPVATDAEFEAMLGRPIPPAEGPRPFRRNSTVNELEASRLGSLLAWVIRRQMGRMVPADDDGTMRALMDNVIVGLPLRGMAAMGGGMTPATLDRIIAALNGHWGRAIRGR